MDVVRITQALRQQQQQPCRQNSVRRGGAGTNMLSVSDEPASLRRSTWDNTNNTIGLSVDTSSDRGTMENSYRASGEASAAAAAAASSSRPSNVGEIESLLLRSMPMFGNLVSRD
ncbi:hypothetical protein BGZ98_010274 [Dissophora globulifera]|nr:hypothetical protein BGZ98_010274 [Dissophora globulifera]